MKTKFIKIYYPESDDFAKFSFDIDVDYCTLEDMLHACTKYSVFVTSGSNLRNRGISLSDYKHKKTMEELIAAIKEVVLYKKVSRWETTTEIEEETELMLPSKALVFTRIKDYGDTILTFFEAHMDTIEERNEVYTALERVGVKESCIGNHYLKGAYELKYSDTSCLWCSLIKYKLNEVVEIVQI